jgi:hypothetical protein
MPPKIVSQSLKTPLNQPIRTINLNLQNSALQNSSLHFERTSPYAENARKSEILANYISGEHLKIPGTTYRTSHSIGHAVKHMIEEPSLTSTLQPTAKNLKKLN